MSPAWNKLQASADRLRGTHLRQLLESENRFDSLSFSAAHLMLDLSRQRIDSQVFDELLELAQERDLSSAIAALLTGAVVNPTENRPALHSALRMPADSELVVEGVDLVAGVHETLAKMDEFVAKIHSGQWRGYTGRAISQVVNIGVGGSDLGPLMTCEALSEFRPPEAEGVEIHFVSSMDGSQLSNLLLELNPETTLFVLSSKSFGTLDTLANASTAIDWLMESSGLGRELLIHQHFIGVTSAPQKAINWGISQKNILKFWDWTGGRYSLWSGIGLPIALTTGMQGFRELLAGAHAMDQHFASAPFEQNLPVLLALIGIWNINFQDIHAHAILPYDGRLAHLPAYLEQLEMESNGKSVKLDGELAESRTCPILWGEIGPNAQHAFYQLLHQGTERVMSDFIVPARRYEGRSAGLLEQHQLALANCLAQARVLALGDAALNDSEERPPWQRYAGNQPSSVILLETLTPASLGSLIALYEHKVYIQAVIWGINPFDQWGVELGKKVANDLIDSLHQGSSSGYDQATSGLLATIQKLQEEH
ncbi:MAG: glucose-6-phosphate isomerase [Oceanospirillaceae bacterium]|nr:glucose-6-phosphate isomerase [Oceanospirillaceae bacterium]